MMRSIRVRLLTALCLAGVVVTASAQDKVTLLMTGPDWGPVSLMTEISKDFTAYAQETLGYPVEIQVDPAPRGSGRILVVDDEPAVVRMAEKLLTRLGYDVVGHDSSVEALRLFREQPDQFDLVITDHSMPDMTGDVLAKELRRIRPTIPIVICTGYSADFTQESAKIAGIDGYILKPSMPAELGHVVSDILTGNRA